MHAPTNQMSLLINETFIGKYGASPCLRLLTPSLSELTLAASVNLSIKIICKGRPDISTSLALCRWFNPALSAAARAASRRRLLAGCNT